jgi:hypothetical protein
MTAAYRALLARTTDRIRAVRAHASRGADARATLVQTTTTRAAAVGTTDAEGCATGPPSAEVRVAEAIIADVCAAVLGWADA